MRYQLIKKKCTICSTVFETYSGKRKTCSKKCRHILLKSIKPLCLICGQAPRVLGHSYCNECFNKKHRESYHKTKTSPDAKRLTDEERYQYKLSKQARYRTRHREQLNDKQRRYYRTHYEIYVQNMEKRRARIMGVPCDLTQSQWDIIKAVYGYKCAYCGKKPKMLTKDHVLPVSKGGGHTANNIVPACRSCNSRKSNKRAPTFQPVLVWVQRPSDRPAIEKILK